ncbi:MAG: hypothetical protein KKI08_27580, partial [Armatimonadetes bacterium]|nr:hypothetical protein [Armatimonadota bacterium]
MDWKILLYLVPYLASLVISIGVAGYAWRHRRVAEERTGELLAANAELRAEIAERQRAEAALKRRTGELEALHQMGLELAAQLDLDSLLHSIVSLAV